MDRLVRRQFAGIDDQPLLRADTSRVLLDQADDAITDAVHWEPRETFE